MSAIHKEHIERLLAAGYELVLVSGWYWLINGTEEPIRANCNSAKAVIRDKNNYLQEFTAKGWRSI